MSNCHSYADSSLTLKHERYLAPLAAIGPLQFIAIDILVPLPMTIQRNQHVVIIRNRHSKLKQPVPTVGTTTTTMACTFFDAWEIL